MAVAAINLLLDQTRKVMNRETELTEEVNSLKARVEAWEKEVKPCNQKMLHRRRSGITPLL